MSGVIAIALLAVLPGFYRIGEGRAPSRPGWQVFDPAGKAVFLRGVDHVRHRGIVTYMRGTPFSHYEEWNQAHYGSIAEWADETAGRLREWGFNALGGDAGDEMAGHGFAYYRGLKLSQGLTVGIGNNTTGAGREGLWICPHEGSPMTEFPNVFHPDFEAYCDRVAAEKCAPHRDDRELVGYFLDNELAWWGRGAPATGLYEAAMRLPREHTARLAAERIGKRDFLRTAAERYFSVVTAAVRRHDPNHLVLGTRFAGLEHNDPVVFEVAGKYCDAISFNCYPWADLDRNVVLTKRLGGERVADAFRRVHGISGKPLLVTEWSFPAIDTPCPSTCGGGQRFRTQRERAQASELFARTLHSLGFVVGYGYFMWVDEPAEGISRVYPENSNYGLVNERGEPYRELVEMFTRLHREADAGKVTMPVERAVAEMPEMTAADFAAKRGIVPAEDFTETDEEWRWTNAAGMTLKGGIGEGRPVRSVTLKDEQLGEIGAMGEYVADGNRCWQEVDRVTTFEYDGTRLEIVAEKVGTLGAKFEMRFRLTLDERRPEYLLELVRVTNVGVEPVAFRGLFLCQYSDFARERGPRSGAAAKVPNLWGEPFEAAWRAENGRVFGARTMAPDVRTFTYYTDARGQHPDAAFAPPDLPAELAAEESYDCRGRVWVSGFGNTGG